MSLDAVFAAISSRRYVFCSEMELQDAIAEALAPLGAQREAHVKHRAGRIDFLVGRIGVECKVDGSLPKVAAQVIRYAHSGMIDALLLVTTIRSHMEVAGDQLGIPVRVLVLHGGIG